MADIDLDEIRKRAEKRLKARTEFYSHLGWYIGINLMLWVIWFLTAASAGEAYFPWPLIVMAAWGIGLIADAVETYNATNVNAQMRRQQALLREIERERELLRAIQGDAPPTGKRKRSARLSDDGEIVYDDGEDPASDEIEDVEPRVTRRRDRSA